MKLFLSYNFKDESLVQAINYRLRKQPALTTYCYRDDKE